MPWCDPCGKYWAPNTVNKDGSCPTCGTTLATQGSLRNEARSLGLPLPGQVEGEAPKAPWHFKLLMLGLAIYLLWRVVQGVMWLIAR